MLSGPWGHRILVVVVTVAAAAACRDAPAPPSRPTTLQSHPRAMRRLARLMRAEYTSRDPAKVEQEIACESERVRRVLGPDFEVRRRHLTDSLAEQFSAEQTRQLGMKLSGVTIAPGSDPLCSAINAQAEREVRLDTAKANEGRGARARE
jgi:hypothetical protein